MTKIKINGINCAKPEPDILTPNCSNDYTK